jgi:hypothetical protein
LLDVGLEEVASIRVLELAERRLDGVEQAPGQERREACPGLA